MYCTQCGKENPQGNAFCTACGAGLSTELQYQPSLTDNKAGKAPKAKNKPGVPVLLLGSVSIILVVALVLSLTGVFGASGAAYASKSFMAPEDVVNYFVGCIKNGDIDGALSACAINEEAKGFDYKAYLERVKAALPMSNTLLPSEYKQYLDYNSTKLRQQAEIQTIALIISFQVADKYKDLMNGKTVMLNSGKLADQIEDIYNNLEPADLKDLTIIEIDKAKQHDTATNRETQKKMANIYGADDEQFRSVLYEYNGDYYMGGFTLIEYNSRWMISNLIDPLTGTSASGCAVKLSGKSDFYSSIGQ